MWPLFDFMCPPFMVEFFIDELFIECIAGDGFGEALLID